MDKELEALDTRMGFLASTGSVAPLVGLFGTVWGIINSFNAIAVTQTNSLSAIAPGIAEALFTTAFGLIAAIPAGWKTFCPSSPAFCRARLMIPLSKPKWQENKDGFYSAATEASTPFTADIAP